MGQTEMDHLVHVRVNINLNMIRFSHTNYNCTLAKKTRTSFFFKKQNIIKSGFPNIGSRPQTILFIKNYFLNPILGCVRLEKPSNYNPLGIEPRSRLKI